MKILITGANAYIGERLVPALPGTEPRAFLLRPGPVALLAWPAKAQRVIKSSSRSNQFIRQPSRPQRATPLAA